MSIDCSSARNSRQHSTILCIVVALRGRPAWDFTTRSYTNRSLDCLGTGILKDLSLLQYDAVGLHCFLISYATCHCHEFLLALLCQSFPLKDFTRHFTGSERRLTASLREQRVHVSLLKCCRIRLSSSFCRVHHSSSPILCKLTYCESSWRGEARRASNFHV